MIKYDIIRYEGVQTKRYRAVKLGTQLASNIDIALNLARGRFGHNVSVRGVNPKNILKIDHSRNPSTWPEVEYGIVEYPKELLDQCRIAATIKSLEKGQLIAYLTDPRNTHIIRN